MATAEVTFSDGRQATIEGTRSQIEAAVREYERSITKPKKEEKGSFVDAVGQGASFGFADELAGLAGAVIGGFDSRLEGTTFGERYRGIRDSARGNYNAFAERNPGTAFGAEVAGGLMTGGLGAARAGAARVASSIPRLMGTGAAVGSVAGTGYSEGESVGEVAGDAVKGALVGGVAGGLVPPVASAIGKVASAPVRYVRATRAARPVKKLGEAIARDDLTAERVVSKLNKMPQGAAIADAGGESLQTLARDITVQPGKGRNIARALFEGRRRLAPQRIDSAVRTALRQPNEFYEAKAAITSQLREKATPLYQEAYQQPVRLTPKLKAVLNRPTMKEALRAGQRMAQDEGEVVGGHIQALDYAKRALDDKIGAAIRAGENQKVRALQRTKTALLEEMDKQVPAYAKARATFAGGKALEDALEEGRKFMRGDAEGIADMLKGMSASEKEFFRMGAIREIRDKVLSKSDTSDAYKAIFNSPLKREKIQQLFPDAKSFAQFQRAMQSEAKMFETSTKVMGGSQTANKLAGVEDAALDPGILVDGVQGGVTAVALNALKTWLRRNVGTLSNEKMRDEIARMLFTADKATQQKILRQIGAPVQVKALNDIPLKIQGAVVGAEQAVSLN